MVEVLAAVILWAVCAVGSYLIANARHSGSPGAWFLLGVLLGPFALAGSLLSGPATARRSRALRIGWWVLLLLVLLAIVALTAYILGPFGDTSVTGWIVLALAIPFVVIAAGVALRRRATRDVAHAAEPTVPASTRLPDPRERFAMSLKAEKPETPEGGGFAVRLVEVALLLLIVLAVGGVGAYVVVVTNTPPPTSPPAPSATDPVTAWPDVWGRNLCRSTQLLAIATTQLDAIDPSIAQGDVTKALAYAESARAGAREAIDLIDAAPRWPAGRAFETSVRAAGVSMLKAAVGAQSSLRSSSADSLTLARDQIKTALTLSGGLTGSWTELFNATGFHC